MQEMRRKTRAFFTNKAAVPLLALVCTALWGTAFPVIKLSYKQFYIASRDIGAKLLFAGERFALAGLLVFLLALVLYRKPLTMKKRDIMPIVTLGLVQTTLQYVFSYIGVANTTGTKTSVITACSAFFAVLLAPLFFQSDQLHFKKIFGCLLGLAGIVVIQFNGVVFESFSFLGEGFVLLSALCSAGGSFISKGVMKNRNAMQVTAFQMFAGGAVLIIIGGAFGGKLYYTNWQHWALLAYLAVVSAIAFTLWTALLAYNPVGKICIFNLMIPLFGTLWSGILLGENIFTLNNLLSIVLVCTGIWLVHAVPGEQSGTQKKKR